MQKIYQILRCMCGTPEPGLIPCFYSAIYQRGGCGKVGWFHLYTVFQPVNHADWNLHFPLSVH